MPLKLDTLGAVAERAVAGGEVMYKLFKRLRALMKPSEETMGRVKEAEKLVKNFTYEKFEEDFQCEMFKGIKVDKFEKFVDELKKRLKLDDTTKESLLEILIMDAKEAHKNDIGFNEGTGKIHYHQIIAMKIDGNINLGITTFTLDYTLDSIISWWLFGFIPIKQKLTSNKALTTTQDQRNKLEILCKVKSFQYIDKKLKNHELED